MKHIAFGIFIGLLFISLVVLFCVLLIKLYVGKVKTYTQLIYQKDIDFQIALNTTIIETQEQVLDNISQDLHDDAGQQLTYINFQLENLKLDSPEVHAWLEPISQSVGNLSKSIRNISHSLNNQLLLQQDLIKAIKSEVERIQNNNVITIKLVLHDEGTKFFTTNEKIVIYRVFQEIINNAFKHSKANAIDISIHTIPSFKMTVRDNGKGFHKTDPGAKNTIGLQNLYNRAAIIDYTIDIQSVPGNGTTVTLNENSN